MSKHKMMFQVNKNNIMQSKNIHKVVLHYPLNYYLQ